VSVPQDIPVAAQLPREGLGVTNVNPATKADKLQKACQRRHATLHVYAGWAVMASLPYSVPAATLCRGIVRHSATGTIRKDSATALAPLCEACALRFYAPISPSFPVLPHRDKRLAQQSLWGRRYPPSTASRLSIQPGVHSALQAID
jgi:hypothetical protein